jgi:hypothetical protein
MSRHLPSHSPSPHHLRANLSESCLCHFDRFIHSGCYSISVHQLSPMAMAYAEVEAEAEVKEQVYDRWTAAMIAMGQQLQLIPITAAQQHTYGCACDSRHVCHQSYPSAVTVGVRFGQMSMPFSPSSLKTRLESFKTVPSRAANWASALSKCH